MTEYRDVHTRDGAATGEVREKHAPRRAGDYFLHAIDILRLRRGGYILQQRSLKARYFPGVWDVTGGGVRSGETPLQAGIREAREELGLILCAEDMREIYSYRIDWDDGTGLFITVFGCIADLPPGGLVPDPAEVNAVRIVSFDEYLRAVASNKDEAYRRAILDFEAGASAGPERSGSFQTG